MKWAPCYAGICTTLTARLSGLRDLARFMCGGVDRRRQRFPVSPHNRPVVRLPAWWPKNQIPLRNDVRKERPAKRTTKNAREKYLHFRLLYRRETCAPRRSSFCNFMPAFTEGVRFVKQDPPRIRSGKGKTVRRVDATVPQTDIQVYPVRFVISSNRAASHSPLTSENPKVPKLPKTGIVKVKTLFPLFPTTYQKAHRAVPFPTSNMRLRSSL